MLSFPHQLESKRLILKAPDPSQAEEFFHLASSCFEAFREPLDWTRKMESAEEAKTVLAKAQNEFSEGVAARYSMFLKESNAMIGRAGYFKVLEGPVLEIGYWCSPEYQGKAYTTEATILLRDTVATLGGHRSQIKCEVSNTASRRVAEKAGFSFQEILEGDSLHSSGTALDMALYSFSPQPTASERP